MKYAVVTVTIGEKYESIAKITHPTIKSYADKINADFIVINDIPKEMKEQGFTPYFVKLSLPKYFKIYDRIIFIDTDCIIREDCPNLFDLVPKHKFGIFKEGEFIPRRIQDLEMAAITYKTKIRMNPSNWHGEYYNTGVMVVSKIHKTIFKLLDLKQIDEKKGWDYGEQGWINLQLINSSTPIYDLDYKFNRMTVMDEKTGEDRHASYIIHYAGAPNELTNPDDQKTITLPEFIQRDINVWHKNKPGYNFKRHILIYSNGGMGDQIDAEPVLRYIKTKAYPNADIKVMTDFPRLFEHLKDDNFSVSYKETLQLKPDTPYYKMNTLPGPETSEIWKFAAHTLCHSTDFSSMSCLRRILSIKDKHIQLKVNKEDIDKIKELTKLDETGLKRSVLIHAGRNWPSKTFPIEWWQKILDILSEKMIPTILIGKNVSEEQGYIDIKPKALTFDLRDRTNIGELIALISVCGICLTNDSVPLHMSGAFDNYLIVIPSCKHPEHILPFRNDSLYYKTSALYKKLTCEEIDSNPTQVHGQTIDWVNGDIWDYLPDTKEVINKILEYKQNIEEEILHNL